jgi:hypothetical protein
MEEFFGLIGFYCCFLPFAAWILIVILDNLTM